MDKYKLYKKINVINDKIRRRPGVPVSLLSIDDGSISELASHLEVIEKEIKEYDYIKKCIKYVYDIKINKINRRIKVRPNCGIPLISLDGKNRKEIDELFEETEKLIIEYDKKHKKPLKNNDVYSTRHRRVNLINHKIKARPGMKLPIISVRNRTKEEIESLCNDADSKIEEYDSKRIKLFRMEKEIKEYDSRFKETPIKLEENSLSSKTPVILDSNSKNKENLIKLESKPKHKDDIENLAFLDNIIMGSLIKKKKKKKNR